MRNGYYSFGNSRIYYSSWGTGPRLLLCLHGYGESGESSAFLGETLEKDYTVLAPDLPFHGKTEWREGLFFKPEDLLSILVGLAGEMPAIRGSWWLLGYSMGGRVALRLLETGPEKIGRLILLAPDGLTMNRWYWLATQTRPGNRLFRWTMRRPGWLFFLLRLGNVLNLVNPSVYKFTIHYIDDEPVRQVLYIRWTTMRGFTPHLAVIREIIGARQLPVRLIYGRYDRIIPWTSGEKFREKGIAAYCRLILVDSGHQLLQARYLDVLLSALKEGGGLSAFPGRGDLAKD